MSHEFAFLRGDDLVLNSCSRLHPAAVRVAALGGLWVMLVGLAALPPLRGGLRLPIPSRVGRGAPSRRAAMGALAGRRRANET